MKEIIPENLNNILHNNTYCVAKGDTGATSHYWMEEHKNVLSKNKKFNGPPVQLPNNEIICATEKGELPLDPSLSASARTAMVLPKLRSSNLISLGQLCDDGCSITLNKHTMKAIKNKKVVLEGTRNKTDGLWDIPIQKRTLTINACIQPKIHPSLYCKRSIAHIIPNSPNSSSSKKQQNIPLHLQHMGNLAASNDLHNAIEAQLKEDEKQLNNKCNIIIKKKQTHMQLIQYLHACCFSPVPSTFTKAIKKGFLKSFPGLTAELVDKYLPISIATAQGHLVQERQHLQSTKTTNLKGVLSPINDLCDKMSDLSVKTQQKALVVQTSTPTQETTYTTHTNEVAYVLINREQLSTGYFDLTGRFPQKSSRGNEYILVGYHYNADAILATAIKDRTTSSITSAWQKMHNTFALSNNKPEVYILDNEKSNELINLFSTNNVKYQLAPPHCHRTNLAERSIQTFKSHFLAGLATCDPDFPLREWDRLLDQAVLTLNLLRSSRTNPKISAYTFLFGEFDFRSTPLAPPGTKLIAHIKPQQRGSWDLHGVQGFYTGPALNHYRCITCYFPKTRQVRICDTVKFIEHTIPIPQTTIDDYLRQAASDIITILSNPPSTTAPSLSAGDPVRNALVELSKQLKRAEPITILSPKPSPRVRPIHTAPSPPIDTTQSPRVQLRNSYDEQLGKNIQVDALEPRNSALKNSRFRNVTNHRYPLRSLANNMQHNVETTPIAYDQMMQHIFDINGKRISIDRLLDGEDKAIWTRSLSNEWGRLASGNDYGVKGTDTINFITKSEVEKDRDVTYATFVCDIKPHKTETHRIRITVGGDRLDCPEDTGSPAANMLETKLLVNSTISRAKYGARFISADITNYFLASPMRRCEYMRVRLKHFPPDIQERYHLKELATSDGWVYIRISKGMYGLRNAAILAYNNLRSKLLPFGYVPVEGTVGLWKHNTRRIKFCLCVDDFGIQYNTKEDADHLLNAIKSNYNYTVDWSGSNYCGMTFDWKYQEGYVDVSMPNYVAKALKRLNYKAKTPQFSPHHHAPIRYAQKGARQYAQDPDTTPLLPPTERRYVQSIVGTLLFYGRAIDYCILPALNDISKEQAKPTVSTLNRAKRVLDYVATFPDAHLRFYASDMTLHVDSDAAYLVAPKARSRIAGFFHCTSSPSQSRPPLNGGVLVECRTLRHVVASAAEAEVAGVFYNTQTAILVRRILHALGHVQPPTPVKTDNSTANGFIHNNIHQKRSKSWDMRYYWLRDKILQKEFNFFWERGTGNYADYFTKHHPTKYHRSIRKNYVRDKIPILTRSQKVANQISILNENLNHLCQKTCQSLRD